MASTQSRKRRTDCRGNFTSFFWDAHADLIRDMMSSDASFSSNGSFCDYSFSEGEEEARYCNVKDPRAAHSLGTAGDSGVASSCSNHSDRQSESPIYSRILSTTRGLRRSQSSSTISDVGRTSEGRHDVDVNDVRRFREETSRWDRSPPMRTPVRNARTSASFHHSRVSTAVPATEGRYNVKKRKIYEDSRAPDAKKPCCWECFEARVERERVSAGLPARTAYLPEPAPTENYYENISFEGTSEAWRSGFVTAANRSLPVRSAALSCPAVPPRHQKQSRRSRARDEEERDEEDDERRGESDTYARLCSIEFSKLRAGGSLFAEERLASLQRKIERLLLIKSNIDLSAKALSEEPEFARAANQVVYRIERRLRAIEAYSIPQFKKITADLISLLACAEKKQKSKMDTLKRGLARAVKVIF